MKKVLLKEFNYDLKSIDDVEPDSFGGQTEEKTNVCDINFESMVKNMKSKEQNKTDIIQQIQQQNGCTDRRLKQRRQYGNPGK